MRDSDGKVIFAMARKLIGDSKLTVDSAQKLGRPWLHLSAADYAPAEKLLGFISESNIKVLDVAGTADRRKWLWPNS